MAQVPSDLSGSPQAGWRARAVDRRTQLLRARAETTSNRLLDAAFELLQEVGTEFTVQDVVERARTSLRTFYQHFEGKDELLLAIFEEALRVGLTAQLEAVRSAGEDPTERLRAFIMGMWDHVRADGRGPAGERVLVRALAVYHLRLSETRPAAVVHVLEPLYDALGVLLRDCRQAGRLRNDLSDGKYAALLVQSLISFLHGHVLQVQAEDLDGSDLWAFVSRGLLG